MQEIQEYSGARRQLDRMKMEEIDKKCPTPKLATGEVLPRGFSLEPVSK